MVSEESVIQLRNEDVRHIIANLFQSKEDGERLIGKRRKSRRPNARVLSTKHRKAPVKVPPKKRSIRSSETTETSSTIATSEDTITVDNAQQATLADGSRNKRTKSPKKVLKRAGKRLEWLLKKGAKYIGLGIIKLFNSPAAAYSADSRINVC